MKYGNIELYIAAVDVGHDLHRRDPVHNESNVGSRPLRRSLQPRRLPVQHRDSRPGVGEEGFLGRAEEVPADHPRLHQHVRVARPPRRGQECKAER